MNASTHQHQSQADATSTTMANGSAGAATSISSTGSTGDHTSLVVHVGQDVEKGAPTPTTSASTSSVSPAALRRRSRAPPPPTTTSTTKTSPLTRKSLSSLGLVCALLFVIMSASVLGLWHSYWLREAETQERDALAMAVDTAHFYSNQLSQAIQPLYTMSNYATEIDDFARLPARVGRGGAEASLPYWNTSQQMDDKGGPHSKRNVQGVCDDPDLMEHFDRLSKTVLKQAHMEGVLANIQFAPYGVVCLLYPLLWNFTTTKLLVENSTNEKVNTTSTTLTLNNTDAIGRDLLNDVRHKEFARLALGSDDIGMVGPRPLVQCPDCGNFFIVRLPVPSQFFQMEVVQEDDTGGASSHPTSYYNRWGYTTVLINWNVLIERSNIQERFRARDMAFQLIASEPDANNETTILVESQDFGHHQGSHYAHRVSTDIIEEYWQWTMTIHYHAGPTRWQTCLVTVGTLVVAAGVSWVVFWALRQRQNWHAHMLAQQAKIELERNMTAYFSHELRNPLSAMECALECIMPLTASMVVSDGNDTSSSSLQKQQQATQAAAVEEQRELLQSMKVCSTFMSSIMNNLLDARKMEEGKMTLRRQTLSLTALVQTVENMLRPSLTKHKDNSSATTTKATPKVILQSRVDTTYPDNNHDDKQCDAVLGDSMRLQQILTNVTNNAIKYTQEGSITISVRWVRLDETGSKHPKGSKALHRRRRKKHHDFHTKDHHQQQQQQQQQPPVLLCLEIADTGPGIPKEDLNQIFERFVQRGGAPGSGLGLAIVKQLVELMHGTIRFESDPTVQPGTTCVIFLPLEPVWCSNDTADVDVDAYHATKEQDMDATKTETVTTSTCSSSSTSSSLEPTNQSNTTATTTLASSGQPLGQQQEDLIQQALSILIVDDIQMNRTMLKRRFQKCIAPNCIITEASSGEEALKLVGGNSHCNSTEPASCFDIIIQDQYLEEAGGVMVGTDVITAMRRAKVDSIIIGYSGNDLDDKFYAAGADLVWSKPMPSNAKILQSLKSLLAEK